MSRKEPGIDAAKNVVLERSEMIASMEPMLIAESSRHRAELNDLVVELAAAAAGFRRALPGGIHSAPAEMFSQGELVLAGVDLDSGLLFAMELCEQ
jgi:hypothetical protein